MFQKPPEVREAVQITFEGEPLQVGAGQTVAAALMAEGHLTLRSSVVGRQPRAAYCMMGVCFECLLEIDGHPNQQACMVLVREGMQIHRPSPLLE
jgi:predicted molibdopterin-dependent oxidoreductase YjgC